MSADVKVVDQNSAVGSVQGGVVPPSPTGSLNKEKAPVGSNLSEFIKPVGQEVNPNLSAEEKEIGAEVKSDRPNLTSEHQELGVEHAVPPVTIPSGSSGSAAAPLSEEEVIATRKTGRYGDSIRWLAELIKKALRF